MNSKPFLQYMFFWGDNKQVDSTMIIIMRKQEPNKLTEDHLIGANNIENNNIYSKDW